jgi:energy-converting hydrogenase Eha subunit B
VDKIKEKMWGAILGFFAAALMCYIGAKLLADVWWVLLIIAVIALGAIIYIRVKKGKPKY